jgi:hypothetical protein
MGNLVYILAASHSGSTMLAMLLAAHPDLCTIGELKLSAASMGDVERYRCSCGQRIRECPFWSAVADEMAKSGHPFDVADARTAYHSCGGGFAHRLMRPLHRGPILEGVRDLGLRLSPAWRREVAETHRRTAALVATLCRMSGARMVVDSSKLAMQLKYLLRNPELNVKVIRLVRDGRGVALAYMDPSGFADAADPALRAGGTGLTHPETGRPMAVAAHEWRRCNEEAECLLARLDRRRWLQLRYEDLCSDPRVALADVFEFLGIEPRKWHPEFRSLAYHVIGNGMRMDSTSQIRLDERWKQVLTTDDLCLFDSVAGDMNHRYGYV